VARRQHLDPQEVRIPSNVILRSLGPEPLVQIDVEGPHPLASGDVYVLCSDGLCGPLTDREIGAVASTLPPEDACRLLVDLANLQGGPDNITLLVIRLGSVESTERRAPAPAQAPWHDRMPWPLAALFLGILLALGAILLTAQEMTTVGILVFLLATVALVSGMVGLLVQSSQEKPAAPLPTETPTARVHRQELCVVDAAYLQRICKALATLETRVKEQGGDVPWSDYHECRERAEQREQAGDAPAAFREYCKALRVLADVLLRHRTKGEAFEPLWETADK
jgi:protein phosphatase